MKRFFLILVVLTLLIPSTVYAQGTDPWSEVFQPDGNLNPDLIDLGVTTDHPDWMSIELPFGQSIDLDANYHRYQTPSGNIVVLPSASTLFFMAMNPQESGLTGSYGSLGNGYGSLITFLGLVAGDNLDWSKVQAEHPDYTSPDQFWGAVLNGQQDVWTYFSGWGFITTLLQMTWNEDHSRVRKDKGPQNMRLFTVLPSISLIMKRLPRAASMLDAYRRDGIMTTFSSSSI